MAVGMERLRHCIVMTEDNLLIYYPGIERKCKIVLRTLDYSVRWVKVWSTELRNKSRVWWKMSSVVEN